MKQQVFKLLTVIVCMLFCINVSAYDFEVDGIYYNITSFNDKTVEVTRESFSSGYSGDIIIPSSIQYQNYTFYVTSIAGDTSDFAYVHRRGAFSNSSITSITIPNSVTKIGAYAFADCENLTTVDIPNSVTIIERDLFSGCRGLKSVNIPNGVTSIGIAAFHECKSLTSINIPNSVTEIGSSAFYMCWGLTSIDIPNSVITIGSNAFMWCSNLTNIDISNSVTTIGAEAFYRCSGLTNIVIPENVTTIGERAFYECSGLTNIVIPNGVIGDYAFENCSNLISIDILNKVIEMGDNSFEGCNNLTQINSYAVIPPKIKSKTFMGNQKYFATLNVPEGCAAVYRAAEYWKDFVNIVENGKPVEPAKKCETPTISYVAGKLKFSCNTEGAEYHYTLTDSDVKNDAAYSDGTVNLDACYKITAYATADGYMQSEKATATLYWINADLETTNINKVQSRGVVASCNDGVIRISGLDEGETVMFYGIDGILMGSQPATAGEVMYAVGSSRNVVIAKIGDDAIKIAVK